MKEQDLIPLDHVRVTDVLAPYHNFSDINPEVLANAARRGELVHQLCELHASSLFIPEIDEDCKPYFEAFIKWFDSTVKETVCLEQRINSQKYKLSGKCDMVVILKYDELPTIVDIKTPQITHNSWQLQTAAYRLLLREELGINCHRRLCIKLPKKGSMAVTVEYENHVRDERLFLNALELYRFFETKKLI